MTVATPRRHVDSFARTSPCEINFVHGFRGQTNCVSDFWKIEQRRQVSKAWVTCPGGSFFSNAVRSRLMDRCLSAGALRLREMKCLVDGSDGMVGLGDLSGGDFSQLSVRGVGRWFGGCRLREFRTTLGPVRSRSGGRPRAEWSAWATCPVGLSTATQTGCRRMVQSSLASEHSAAGQEAFRWTAATGMVGLGDFPERRIPEPCIWRVGRRIGDRWHGLFGHGERGVPLDPGRWDGRPGSISPAGTTALLMGCRPTAR